MQVLIPSQLYHLVREFGDLELCFRTICYIAMFSFFEEVSSRRSLGFTQHGERMLLRQVSQLPLISELIVAHQKVYIYIESFLLSADCNPTINVPAINVQDKQII